MKITESKQRRLRHYINAPKRFLRRARDLYVDSLVSIDSKVGSANIITCPTPNTSHMPKNYSSNTMKDDEERLEEMYRSICSKYNGNRVESDRGGCLRDKGSGYGAIDRSYSIALGKIGTIDEDEPCEFQENVAVKNDLFLRSRSHIC